MSLRSILMAAIAVIVFGTSSAPAQDYPSKPIRIIVGFSAGGLADQIGRLFADFISRDTGQAAVILPSLVDRITLTPNSEGRLEIDLHGNRAGILVLAANKSRPLDPGELSV